MHNIKVKFVTLGHQQVHYIMQLRSWWLFRQVGKPTDQEEPKKGKLAYISDKFVSFTSVDGNSPVKAFEDRMLMENSDNVNAS